MMFYGPMPIWYRRLPCSVARSGGRLFRASDAWNSLSAAGFWFRRLRSSPCFSVSGPPYVCSRSRVRAPVHLRLAGGP